MRRGTRSLEGQTALVVGGGSIVGRAIALALSARGVRIVVTGRDEKALGETVGEIVHGGGKARHLAGDPRHAAHLDAAVERAMEVFGRLDIAIDVEGPGAEATFRAASARLQRPGRLLVTSAGEEARSLASELLAAHAPALFAKGITCNGVVLEGAANDDDLDALAPEVGALVVFLCGSAADGLTGQRIAIRRPVEVPSAPPSA